MDISMPRGGGLAAIAAIKAVRPRTRILVLTVHDELGYVRAAADAGAIGYVVKNAVDTELLAAIRAVAEGRTFMDISGGMGLSQSSMSRRPPSTLGGREATQLTGREREVMARVAEGFHPTHRSPRSWGSASSPSRPIARGSWRSSGSRADPTS